jgi:hypothetical protein
VQALLTRVGGARETRAAVATLTNEAENILGAYAADGGHLADVAWRPHEPSLAATGGLFLC